MNQTGSTVIPQHLNWALETAKKKVSMRISHNTINYKTNQIGMSEIFQIENRHKLLK